VVDPYTGTPLWDGERPDLGLAVEWFLGHTAGGTVTSAATADSAMGSASAADRTSDESDTPSDDTPCPPPGVDSTPDPKPFDDEDDEDDKDDEDDPSYWCTPSPARLAELEAMSAATRGPSALTYELFTEDGEHVPFQEAVFRPEFCLEWNED
jgi:hypothetical protein